jgi:hydroxylamine reductase (hybrid-cluster protein)
MRTKIVELNLRRAEVVELACHARRDKNALQRLYSMARGEETNENLTSTEAWEVQAAAEDSLEKLGEIAEPYLEEVRRAREW